MIDAVKDYLAPKRFGVVAYVCLIVHFLCGLAFTAVTSALRAAEVGKFSCTIDTKSSAVYKNYVDKTCYSRYEQTYNSPLPLYGFVLFSIGFTVLVSVIYSLGVSTRIEEIDRISNGSDESGTDVEETSHGFYVFYFYFLHLAVRSLFAIVFTVLQHTLFYPNGFDFEFSCNLPTTNVISQVGNNMSTGLLNNNSIACENSSASEKLLWSMIVSVLNSVFALITLGEAIYLIWRRFPILGCRSVDWSCDKEFVTIYLLRKRYAQVEHELLSVQDNLALCIDFYKRQVLNPSRTHDISYGQKTDLNDMYIDVVIHTGRAQHKISKEMERHEIFDVYTKIPESSIHLKEIKDLFYPNQDTKGILPRTILAVGRPGIGKTVLTEKIIRDWANGVDEIYCDKIAFILKFRWFNFEELKNLSLKTFLRYGTGLSEEEFESIFEEILNKPQKAILIFDGLDEFNGDVKYCLERSRMLPNDPNTCMSGMTLFIKLAYGNMLQGALVLVTSRPTADDFYSNLDFDRSVEIIGFTSDKIEEYVSRFCDNIGRSDLKPKIWNYVKSSSDLLNLCYIPVNCFIVCGTLSDPRNDTDALPATLTEFYQTAVDHFALKHNRNSDAIFYNEMAIDLQKLAFCGLENGQLVFNKQLFDERMKKSGLVNSLSNPICPIQTQFCFIHLTIQEFLAARHLTETLSPDEIEKFISTHIESGKWHLVFQFIAGLLGEKIKMSGCDYHECIMAFTKGLTLDDGKISLGDYGNVLVMKCLREVVDEDIVKKACKSTDLIHVTSITYNVFWTPYPLSTSELKAVTFVCKHLNHLKYLKLNNANCEDSWFLEIGKLLQHRCLECLVLVLSGSDFAKKQLTCALMKSKCTLNHEHAMLSRLYLNIGMTDECVSNVCALTKNGHGSHLETLDLSVNKITSSGIPQICEVFNDVLYKNLTCLNLSNNAIGDEGVGMICNTLTQRRHCKLSRLFLDSCSLTNECLRYLCEVLCNAYCKLSELSLAENTIGDEGVRMLCTNALIDEQCELIILSLDYCGLTDQWVGLLSKTLQHGNCKLAIVGLSGNNFTEEGQSILRDVQKTEICEARCLDLYGLT